MFLCISHIYKYCPEQRTHRHILAQDMTTPPLLSVLTNLEKELADSITTNKNTSLLRLVSHQTRGAIQYHRKTIPISAKQGHTLEHLLQGLHGIIQCNNVETLNICYIPIGVTEALQLALVLQRMHSLKHLNLKSCELMSGGVYNLCQALSRYHLLTTLDLSSNRILNQGAGYLASVLPACRHLKHLDVSDNEIQARGARTLGMALPDCMSLEYFSIARNSLRIRGASGIADCVYACKSIKSLDVSFNDMKADGTKFLARVLPWCSSLTELNISTNAIGDQGAMEIGHVLPQCVNITNLVLAANEISDDGAQALAAGFREYKKLAMLDMAANYLETWSVHELVSALADNTCIQTLDFSNNIDIVSGDRIGPLAQEFTRCTSLRTLRIAENTIIDTQGLSQLLECGSFTSLTELDMSSLNIINHGQENIEHMTNLGKCTSLTALDVSFFISGIGENLTRSFAQAIGQLTLLKSLNLEK